MNKISVVIITLNEAENIGRCLSSVDGVADEIIVVDSGSTDSTKAICQKFGAKFIEHAFEGYGRQKRFAQEQASNNWILSLDADEELTPELKSSILAAREAPQADAYSMNRLNFYYGHPMRFGDLGGDWCIRFFNGERVKWDDAVVHELPITKGIEVKKLKGRLNHYTERDVASHRAKIERYARLSTEKLVAKGRKITLVGVYLKTAWAFFRSYILHLCIFDGYSGLMRSCMSARYVYLKYNGLRNYDK